VSDLGAALRAVERDVADERRSADRGDWFMLWAGPEPGATMSSPTFSSAPEARRPPARWREPGEPGLMTMPIPFVRVRPGDRRIGALRDALHDGDPLADRLALWVQEAPAHRALFARAVERGIGAISSPPEPLTAFFAEVDAVPRWLDRDAVRLGTETMLRVGPAGYAALGSVSLMSGYLSSGAVKPLAMTGQLVRMARRRLVETSKFVLEVSVSGDVGRFSPAYRAALHVRLIHALVRSNLRSSPTWRTELWGEPINQHDMVGTHLEFSSMYILGLRMQGYLISRREREAVMHLWRHLGRALGVREDLLPTSFSGGLELGWIINHTEAGPDQDSRALAAALMAAGEEINLENLGPLLGRARARLETGLSRFALGRRAADALGVPDDVFQYAPYVLAPLTAAREIAHRIVPGARSATIRMGEKLAKQAIDGLLEGKPPPFVPAEAS
jgi:hypothetical protein